MKWLKIAVFLKIFGFTLVLMALLLGVLATIAQHIQSLSYISLLVMFPTNNNANLQLYQAVCTLWPYYKETIMTMFCVFSFGIFVFLLGVITEVFWKEEGKAPYRTKISMDEF